MSAKPLGKLEKLADKRADQSRIQLARETQAMRQLESQHRELRAINAEYQQALVGNENVAPQSLAHRRAFVTQLTGKIDELAVQKQIKQKTVEQHAQEYHKRMSQHTAIDLVNKERVKEIEQSRLRKEQQQLDESASQQHFLKQNLNSEHDHE